MRDLWNYGIFSLFDFKISFCHHFCPYFQIYVVYMDFKALFRRYRTSKIGFQPTIFDFLKFVAFSAPNEISFVSVNKTTHTLHIIVNQPYNIIFFFDLLPLENCDFCKLWQILGLFSNFNNPKFSNKSSEHLNHLNLFRSSSLKGFKIFDWTPIRWSAMEWAISNIFFICIFYWLSINSNNNNNGKCNISRFGSATQVLPSDILVHFLCLLEKQNALHLPVFSIFFFSTTFLEFGAKKIFYRPSNSQYNSAICCYKRNVSSLFFFWKSCSKGEFPRDYLINVATCLFA